MFNLPQRTSEFCWVRRLSNTKEKTGQWFPILKTLLSRKRSFPWGRLLDFPVCMGPQGCNSSCLSHATDSVAPPVLDTWLSLASPDFQNVSSKYYGSLDTFVPRYLILFCSRHLLAWTNSRTSEHISSTFSQPKKEKRLPHLSVIHGLLLCFADFQYREHRMGFSLYITKSLNSLPHVQLKELCDQISKLYLRFIENLEQEKRPTKPGDGHQCTRNCTLGL